MLRQQITERLEQTFSEHGFAEPGVAQLKEACEVSLRTLYKHYPSKEAMVIGALEARHQRYLARLADCAAETSAEMAQRLFEQLGLWMRDCAPNGCLSMNALTAFPDSEAIRTVVDTHKSELRAALVQLTGNNNQSDPLFLLHEGVCASWPLMGDAAVDAAKSTAMMLFKEV
ncbi:TetR/AcrR family transcriptional regulator [Ferrimonas balearica]|uniref:TetR/AcrR family transcriptional regulator n=1 Tax=Ferrimonas balearica TaxID=44012 RepID=UPI002D7F3D8C|nr:TetR/AcrR family transcriptional regulator [Ferrimonas balearica]MBY6093442.1 TetR/AcrR family transcriptional regulator [Ferrimonas balearica]